MKVTGVVRRIDGLGRIVIPKEIRNAFRLREGDPMEIFITKDGVLLTKYNPTSNIEEDAQKWLQENRPLMEKYKARFNIAENLTVCEVIIDNTRVTGEAKCNPKDIFSPAIGMIYAFCRAAEMKIPEELNY